MRPPLRIETVEDCKHSKPDMHMLPILDLTDLQITYGGTVIGKLAHLSRKYTRWDKKCHAEAHEVS